MADVETPQKPPAINALQAIGHCGFRSSIGTSGPQRFLPFEFCAFPGNREAARAFLVCCSGRKGRQGICVVFRWLVGVPLPIVSLLYLFGYLWTEEPDCTSTRKMMRVMSYDRARRLASTGALEAQWGANPRPTTLKETRICVAYYFGWWESPCRSSYCSTCSVIYKRQSTIVRRCGR